MERCPLEEQINAVCQRVRQVAASEQLISYGEVAMMIGIGTQGNANRNTLTSILDQINQREVNAGRPLLSALVVHQHGRTPGPGFYNCARALGRLRSRDEVDEIAFWANEVKAVYACWRQG